MRPSPDTLCSRESLESAGAYNTAPTDVQRLDPSQVNRWDQLIRSQADYSFFHGAAWARVLASTYRYAPAYFAMRQGDQLLALIPVMEVDSWLTGRRGVSLPFTDECPPLGTNPAALATVHQVLLEYGRSRGWRYFECRGGQPGADKARASMSFYRHTLSLKPGEQGLFAALAPSIQRALRKAQKEGVTTEISRTPESLRTYYELHCQTRQRHGLPPQPYAFFERIHEHVLAQNLGMVVLARWQDQAVAGAVFFHLGRRAVFKYGASDAHYQPLRGNNLVMWTAIQWYARQGFELLHWGRTSLENEGLRRFKRGWATAEDTIDYSKFDLKQNTYVTETSRETGWHNRWFRWMPVRLSRWLGNALYPHLG